MKTLYAVVDTENLEKGIFESYTNKAQAEDVAYFLNLDGVTGEKVNYVVVAIKVLEEDMQ